MISYLFSSIFFLLSSQHIGLSGYHVGKQLGNDPINPRRNNGTLFRRTFVENGSYRFITIDKCIQCTLEKIVTVVSDRRRSFAKLLFIHSFFFGRADDERSQCNFIRPVCISGCEYDYIGVSLSRFTVVNRAHLHTEIKCNEQITRAFSSIIAFFFFSAL